MAFYNEARYQTALRVAGQCIYCGMSDDLSKEHVVPLGLGGNLYVPQASCPRCRDVTSRFEQSVLKGFMARARIAGKFPTRHPRKRPADVTVTLLNGDTERDFTLPSREVPAVLQLPTFEAPRFLTGLPKIAGINVCGRETIGFGDVEGTIRRHGATGFRQTDDIRAVEFARMLAKIGYSYTVGVFGLIPLDRVFVLPLIRGEADDAGHWVGSAQFETESEKRGALHALTHTRREAENGSGRRILVARVKLFASSGATGFEVVICEM